MVAFPFYKDKGATKKIYNMGLYDLQGNNKTITCNAGSMFTNYIFCHRMWGYEEVYL